MATYFRDAAEWLCAFLAFRLYLVLPADTKIAWAVLPAAGLYAYTEGGFTEYRRVRKGFMTCVDDRNPPTIPEDVMKLLSGEATTPKEPT